MQMTQGWEHTDEPAEGVCMVNSVMFAPVVTIPYKATDDVMAPTVDNSSLLKQCLPADTAGESIFAAVDAGVV